MPRTPRFTDIYLIQLMVTHIKSADDANIITTWEIPFRRIAIRESVEHRDAVDLMHVFAFMHFESIPERIFQRYWNPVKGTESGFENYPDILQDNISLTCAYFLDFKVRIVPCCLCHGGE